MRPCPAEATPTAGGDSVVLVTGADRAIGVGEKMQVHREGRLHRAFSVFVFDRRGRLLLQRRARGKYHSGGLWSNTCCGHPRAGERVAAAAERRLMEEMGFSCTLTRFSSFVYRAQVGNGLIENEFDHLLCGRYDAAPVPDATEVMEWDWRSPEVLERDLRRDPHAFSTWLRGIVLSSAIGAGDAPKASSRRA